LIAGLSVTLQMFEGEIGWKSDVWGIGCLIYEMASGFPLYHKVRHQTREQLRAAVSIIVVIIIIIIFIA